MVNKSDYTIQVLQKLLDMGNKSITKADFENLYNAACGESIEENPKTLIDKVVKSLFDNELIPWSFFDTPLGEVIGIVKFKDETLLLPEIAELLECSIQNIHKIKDDLEAVRKGKNWVVKESALDEWLKKNGKPSLWELKKIKQTHEVKYEIEEERIINPGFEAEGEYK